MLKKSLLVSLLTLIGCSQNEIKFPEIPIHHTVHLDSSFSGIEEEIIKNSLLEWTTATQGFLSFKFDSFPIFNPNNSINPFGETDSNCTKHLMILRNLSTDSSFVQAEKNLGYKIWGWAQRSSQPCGTSYIFLAADRMKTTNMLRLITLHEIGHAVGNLKHSPDSVMQMPGFTVNGITEKDLLQLIEKK